MLEKAAILNKCELDILRKGMFLLDSLVLKSLGLDCQNEHIFWRPLECFITPQCVHSSGVIFGC